MALATQGRAPRLPSSRLNFWESFLLSGTAAAVSKTSAAPIERIKLLVQNQNELVNQGRLDKPYKSIADCLRTTLRHEGILSFWRGNLASVIRYFPQQALNFAFKDKIQLIFKISSNQASYAEKFTKNVASGGAAGALSLLFVQSIDYTRTRLAVDARAARTDRQFRGIIDCYVKTIRSDGIRGLYRGFFVSCLCIIIYRGLYFGLFDSLKPLVLKIDPISGSAQWLPTFLLGYGVTIVSGLVAYPVDSVKRRMMMSSGERQKYKSALNCAKQIIAKEGFRALFNGAAVNVVRGVAGAGVLTGFDQLKAVYTGYKRKNSGFANNY